MNNTVDLRDRRREWAAPVRPEWLRKFNELGTLMDINSIVPLEPDLLLDQARRNTGLNDFGDDEWRAHFLALLESIKSEANLNFFGRVLTRSDFVTYLEARLRITELYKTHPEIDRETVSAPVFIVGYGRTGTTILLETLSHDPQFRTVRRWEAQFPCPPPTEETYGTDPRIRKAQGLIDVVDAVSPEWASMHVQGGDVPVEDIEFTYPAFFSDVWTRTFRIPSYERYFLSKDMAYYFFWHKRTLKLLQWKFKRRYWLLKNPTYLSQIPEVLAAYPDAKFIFTHRDPCVTHDSSTNVMGTIYSWRTDDPWAGELAEDWASPESRAVMWDPIIAMMENGSLREDQYVNVLFHEFNAAPIAAIDRIYTRLNLPKADSALKLMTRFLDGRPVGGAGRGHAYKTTAESDPVLAKERLIYKRYQEYFRVPNER